MSESYNKYGLSTKCACGAEFTVYDGSGQNGPLRSSSSTSYQEYAEWKERHKECHTKILELRAQNAAIA